MAKVEDIEITVKVVSEPVKQRCTTDFGDHSFDAHFLGEGASWTLLSSTLLLVCEKCAMAVEVSRASRS